MFAAFEVYAQDGDADEFDYCLPRGRAALPTKPRLRRRRHPKRKNRRRRKKKLETDESLALFRGAICREVDDLLTKGELAQKAAKAVLTALLRSEGTDSASPVDRALCRLAGGLRGL